MCRQRAGWVALALVALASGAASGQGSHALLLADPVEVKSAVLGETRSVVVSLPFGYAGGDERYPVLYLLDGGAHLVHTRATLDFLAANGLVPQMILVAVLHADRVKDLTPTRGEPSTSGGGMKFLEFLATELIPLVEGRYRTQPFRVLCGHSFGGLLAMTAVATRPGLFQGVVAASPSLGWDGGWVMQKTETLLREALPTRVSLFVTLANEGGGMRDGVDRLERLLTAAKVPGLRWAVQRMPDEDHGSVVLRSHYQGLRMIFDGWKMPWDLVPDLARIDDGAVRQHYEGLSKRLGFPVVHRQDQVAELCAAAVERRDVGRALGLCRLNADAYPRVASVQFALGRALELAARTDEAIRAYERAIMLGSTSHDSFVPVYRRRLEALKATMR